MHRLHLAQAPSRRGRGHSWQEDDATLACIDVLVALVQWVEQGKPPQALEASGTAVFPGLTRPVCAYPTYAHYTGSGNPQDAANFACR